MYHIDARIVEATAFGEYCLEVNQFSVRPPSSHQLFRAREHSEVKSHI